MVAQYAPGQDDIRANGGSARYNPQSSGSGGVFAGLVKGSTPKYARNAGPREEQSVGTMARLYVRVDADEFAMFRESVGDSIARQFLVDRIAGDPTAPRTRGQTIIDSGYVDFLLTDVSQPLAEKYQTSETLADNHVAYFFGQSAPLWSYSGKLINTVQDDQVVNFFRLYIHMLRGTQLARRQKIVSIKYDSFMVAGALVNLRTDLNSANELLVPFSFQVLVKRFDVTNFTPGWTPTNPGGPFSTDPYAVAYDSRPREDASVRSFAARVPPDTEERPGSTVQEDPRVHEPPVPEQTSAGHAAETQAAANNTTGQSTLNETNSLRLAALHESGVGRAPEVPVAPDDAPPGRQHNQEQANALLRSAMGNGRPETASPPAGVPVADPDTRLYLMNTGRTSGRGPQP